MDSVRLCQILGCGRHFHAKGYCLNHYARWRYYGDALKGRDSTSIGEPLRWIKENADYAGNDCIKWPFEITHHGYGSIKHNGMKRVASRVMCEIAHGSAPNDKEAAHSCGNGHLGCMNPNHLSWKTRAENMVDAIRHGTWNHGERVCFAKLTSDDVLKIRAIGKSKMQRDIAKQFGVDQSQISRILSRKEWGWLDG